MLGIISTAAWSCGNAPSSLFNKFMLLVIESGLPSILLLDNTSVVRFEMSVNISPTSSAKTNCGAPLVSTVFLPFRSVILLVPAVAASFSLSKNALSCIGKDCTSAAFFLSRK